MALGSQQEQWQGVATEQGRSDPRFILHASSRSNLPDISKSVLIAAALVTIGVLGLVAPTAFAAVPGVSTPKVSAPAVSTPTVSAPTVSVPTVSARGGDAVIRWGRELVRSEDLRISAVNAVNRRWWVLDRSNGTGQRTGAGQAPEPSPAVIQKATAAPAKVAGDATKNVTAPEAPIGGSSSGPPSGSSPSTPNACQLLPAPTGQIVPKVTQIVPKDPGSNGSTPTPNPTPKAVAQILPTGPSLPGGPGGPSLPGGPGGSGPSTQSPPTQIVGSVVNTVTTAPAQILPSLPALPGPGPSGPGPSGPTPVVGSIVDTITRTPATVLPSVQALPILPSGSSPSGPSGPTPVVGSIVDTITRTPATVLPSVQALPILPSGSSPSGPSGPTPVVGSIVDTITRTPATVLPSVQALPILPSGSSPSGPSGPTPVVGSIVDTITRTPAQLLPSVPTTPSSPTPTLISPTIPAALLIPSQTVAPAPVVDGTGAGVGAPPGPAGPLGLEALLKLGASPDPSRPQSRHASSAPATGSGPSGTVSSPIAAPSGDAIGSTAPPAPRTSNTTAGGLALVAEALGFAAMFGLPTIVSIRFTDILLSGPAIQFLTSYGLQLPASLTSFDSSRTVGDGATQPSPDRTPIPAPDALLHAVVGAQASLMVGGLLAVLFLMLLTAPHMGRQLRVPATSWWSPGYVSPVELPG